MPISNRTGVGGALRVDEWGSPNSSSNSTCAMRLPHCHSERLHASFLLDKYLYLRSKPRTTPSRTSWLHLGKVACCLLPIYVIAVSTPKLFS